MRRENGLRDMRNIQKAIAVITRKLIVREIIKWLGSVLANGENETKKK